MHVHSVVFFKTSPGSSGIHVKPDKHTKVMSLQGASVGSPKHKFLNETTFQLLLYKVVEKKSFPDLDSSSLFIYLSC